MAKKGSPWRVVYSQEPYFYFNRVWGSGPNSVMAVGDFGFILRTKDGGESFYSVPSGTTEDLEGLTGNGTGNVYAVGTKGTIVHSADDGVTWTRQRGPVPNQVLSGVWVSEKQGDIFAVGYQTLPNGGLVLYSSGDGQWKAQPGIPNMSLYDVWGVQDDIYAIGPYGAILRSKDHGASWTREDSGMGTMVDLFGVWGSGSDDVWIVGRDTSYRGIILHSTGDGTWRRVPSSSPTLDAVWGGAPDDIYFVGQAGTVLHYDGETIRGKVVPTSDRLFSVWGSGSDDVYAVGGPHGTILNRRP